MLVGAFVHRPCACGFFGQILTCFSSDGFCEPVELGRVDLESPGIMGSSPEYAVSARLILIQVRCCCFLFFFFFWLLFLFLFLFLLGIFTVVFIIVVL